MKIGIVGHTGLVGSYIANENRNSLNFNTSNIETIRRQHFNLLFISAMPATKWMANKYPEDDQKNRLRLQENLSFVSADKVVLVSTVDVFQSPNEVNESTLDGFESTQGYGRNRFLFELFIQNNFKNVWVVRLPGLVGKGLKKNVLFDIKHNKPTESIPLNSRFQFYPLDRLVKDIDLVLNMEPGIFHFSVAPLEISDVVQHFQLNSNSFAPATDDAPNYNFTTTKLPTGDSNYLVSRAQSLEAIERYLNED